MNPSNKNAACDYLLDTIFLSSFDNFSILAPESKNHLLKIKGGLPIK